MSRLLPLRFAFAVAVLAASAACNDAARCQNACQREADCGFIDAVDVDRCADLCEDELDRVTGACREAQRDAVACLQFASCEGLTNGTACDTQIAESVQACSSMDDMSMNDMNSDGMDTMGGM